MVPLEGTAEGVCPSTGDPPSKASPIKPRKYLLMRFFSFEIMFR
jgi:hypothetical protein